MITTEDGPRAAELRADKVLMAAHWAYELSIKDRILAAGSLRSDDGKRPVGSLLILDTTTRDEALALLAADPATVAGVRGTISIRYWNPAILNCQEI